jgi:hypothetical protein
MTRCEANTREEIREKLLSTHQQPQFPPLKLRYVGSSQVLGSVEGQFAD